MNKDVPKILGYILLSPALVSVLIFLTQLFIDVDILDNFKFTMWTGRVFVNEGGGGGYTSALPFYFGLMAIAGAYLIKERK
jgi:hypothetical protein